MLRISYIIAFLLMSLSTLVVSAQPNINKKNTSKVNAKNAPFEGIIKFVQETFSDTIYYTYYVKGNNIKIEINEDCADCDGADAMLFNLKAQTIIALKPSLRMYKDVDVKPYVKSQDVDYSIIQNTHNSKKIEGYDCEQWRVKNQKENTEITYWVTQGNFYFFDDFLKLWNRSEKHSRYFLQIKNLNGYFPILSVERSSLRDTRMKLQVVKIINKPLETSVFEIPSGYKNYDN